MRIETAKTMGKIPNYLGLLNKNHDSFFPNRLISIASESPSSLATKSDIPRSYFYKEEISLKKNMELKNKIIALVTAGDLAYELMNGNKNEVIAWLISPNLEFFGSSPFDVCLRGQGKHILEWLYVRLGKQPGIAF